MQGEPLTYDDEQVLATLERTVQQAEALYAAIEKHVVRRDPLGARVRELDSTIRRLIQNP